MAEEWEEKLNVFFEDMEKSIGEADAREVMKFKYTKIKNQQIAERVLFCCGENFKKEVKERFKLIKYKSDNACKSATAVIGDLTIYVEREVNSQFYYSSVVFSPPTPSGKDTFELDWNMGISGKDTYGSWSPDDFLEVMKIAEIYNVSVSAFVGFLDALGAICESWVDEQNDKELRRGLKFKSKLKSARSVLSNTNLTD